MLHVEGAAFKKNGGCLRHEAYRIAKAPQFWVWNGTEEEAKSGSS